MDSRAGQERILYNSGMAEPGTRPLRIDRAWCATDQASTNLQVETRILDQANILPQAHYQICAHLFAMSSNPYWTNEDMFDCSVVGYYIMIVAHLLL